MYAVERLSSYFCRGVYTVSGPFHPFGGAVDIIVVQQQDGSFKSSPWYVRFGKFQGVLKTKEKVVDICVNGTEAEFPMYLDHKGEAYFLREVEGDEGESVYSPPSSGDEAEDQPNNERLPKSKSLDFHDSNSVTEIDMGNGKIVTRTNSKRSRIFGLVFGRKSMKEDIRNSNEDGNMQSISSLERAEIAADLLEMKWATNLSNDNRKREKNLGLPAPEMPLEESDKGVKATDNQTSEGTSVQEDSGIETKEYSEKIIGLTHPLGDNCGNDIVDGRYSEEITSLCHPCLKTNEITTLEMKDSVGTDILPSEQSIQETSEVSNENNAVSDEIVNVSISEATILDIPGPTVASDSSLGEHLDAVQSPDKCDGLVTTRIFPEENGKGRVCSYIYSETSETSSVRIDLSSDQSPETPADPCNNVEVCTEVLYETTELFSEVSPGAESGELTDNETLNEQFDSYNSNAGSENKGISGHPTTDSIEYETKTISLLDTDLPSSNPVEVINQDTVAKELKPEKTSRLEMVEICENQEQMKDLSSSHFSSDNEVGHMKASETPDYPIRMFGVDGVFDATKEAKLPTRFIPSHPSGSTTQVQEVGNHGEGAETHELHLSSDYIVSPQKFNVCPQPRKEVNHSIFSSGSSEDQIFFSDSDNFLGTGVQCEDLIAEDELETDDHSMEGSEGDHVSNGMGRKSSGLHTEELVQESSPDAQGDLHEEPRNSASPICIPKGRTRPVEVEQLFGSLPYIRAHVHDLQTSDMLRPLSHSLDLHAQNSNWDMHREDFSKNLKLSSASESKSMQDWPSIDGAAAVLDSHSKDEYESTSAYPGVEISLCRHLLSEGMGAEAASQAFDSEKVDLEKFTTLGPSVVKNDKLVVRIGSCYFPWDAAAPFILGMVSFGQEQIFGREGSIPVDKVEKTLEGEQKGAISPSGGSWRLWPFSFRKSKTVRSIHPAPYEIKSINGDNASQSTSDVTGDNNMPKASSKKKVRSLVPTSDQLASLNLKEGKNVITFTYSTAMLGRQQVDARIYLWKWNTRIVVSDVDGTITKSDVLGQFMPLVGKDWSQTGVTHLFSAIKDNGYQLLFLSARAIAQAYLTRQFLFNLKQDGKALPDGPVVISPDGLFPSLYREVIRRAPHEFKIACLEDIRALFPPDCNPFYAGFGNRDTDEISYLKVGIPKGKIFIVNPKGVVVVNRQINTKSYTSLHSLVNGMFPAMSSAEQEDFNSWNYWKMPLPDVTV